MRKADDARLHFWGLSQMEREDALEAVGAAKSLWFLGDLYSEWDSYWCAHFSNACLFETFKSLKD